MKRRVRRKNKIIMRERVSERERERGGRERERGGRE